jgi:hypothetical protein
MSHELSHILFIGFATLCIRAWVQAIAWEQSTVSMAEGLCELVHGACVQSKWGAQSPVTEEAVKGLLAHFSLHARPEEAERFFLRACLATRHGDSSPCLHLHRICHGESRQPDHILCMHHM